MSNVIQLKFPNPMTTTEKIQNVDNTTQIINDHIVLFRIAMNVYERLLDTNERKGIIRKPSTAKPNMLETFKPTIHSLVPELQQLTDNKLYSILEEDDDE